MKSLSKIVMLSVFIAVLFPMLAGAQGGIGGINPTQPVNDINITNIIDRIVTWAFGLLLALAVVFIIWAAFLYLTSGGNEEKVDKAKSYIIAAVIAIVIAALARLIVAVVKQLLGVQ